MGSASRTAVKRRCAANASSGHSVPGNGSETFKSRRGMDCATPSIEIEGVVDVGEVGDVEGAELELGVETDVEL
ncbi:hypothetical protein Q0P57_13705, partial [Staphylococcus aureus]|nr:hypothetical protein [Staphylococcus aureus]